MDKGTLLTMLIAIGAPALSSIGAALIAKFLPRQKLADWGWAGIYFALEAIDKFLKFRAKLGNKSTEIIEETILGTISYCLKSWGTRIDNWLFKRDTDGSVK